MGFAYRGASVSQFSEHADPRLQASRRCMEESSSLSCVVSNRQINPLQSLSVPNSHRRRSGELKPSQVPKRVDCWLSPEQLEYSKKLKRTSPLEDRIVYNGLREGAARKVKVTLERQDAPLTQRELASPRDVQETSRCFSATGNYDSNNQRRMGPPL